MRRSPLYWPGLCVAGLCIGGGVGTLSDAPTLGVFVTLTGFLLAHLTMKGAHQ